ncbi:apolipoprotein N-acyltransferase [Pseudomaricurvus sp.]|uniref:apolipoprotein N-acyltransferase n=1 Tax=Pseudomaricurvus sp. TaxID=2004510 RepID=UPI003F6D6318
MTQPVPDLSRPSSRAHDLPTSWLADCPFWLRLLLTTLAGSLTPLALAPLDWWPLALVTPACLALLSWNQYLKPLLSLCFGFGLGMFGVGVSWVYVSIHEFGYAPVWLAVLLTAIFVAFMALLFTLPFGLIRWTPRLLRKKHTDKTTAHPALATHGLMFCALWVLGEWSRSWFMTGFPWLLIGYSQWHTALSGWAPISGIYSLSLAVLISSCGFAYLALGKNTPLKIATVLVIASFWLGGQSLRSIAWTQPAQPTPLSVSLVQPNIPQEKKWQPDFLQPTLERYSRLSEDAWQSDWVIWPEAAIPLLYHQATPFLEQANNRALQTQTALITGILYDDSRQDKYFNSAVGLGLASGIYHKTRLVPFGEYVPLEDWLRGLIQFFNLPTSIISQGPEQQSGLQIGSNRLASAICYEIVYPDLVANSARNREVILTISNDGWFGHSWGPLQHLEMAQMRALETGRYVIRATNNGVSALITPQGELQQRSEQFIQTVLTGSVTPMTGNTPFMRWGSLPIVALCFALLAIGLCQTRASLRR